MQYARSIDEKPIQRRFLHLYFHHNILRFWQKFDVIHYNSRILRQAEFHLLLLTTDVGQYIRGCGHLPIISIQTK